MTPERPEQRRAGGGIPAQQRLAQTRSEIAALILPPYVMPAGARPVPPRQQQQRAQADADEMAQALLRQRQAELAAAERMDMDYAMHGMQSAPPIRVAPASARSASGFAWRPMLRRGVSIWWRHHPAHAVVEVADSMLSHVARRKPWQMLAVAAGVGALAMLIRPWRLISVTGLALAALKAGDLRSMVGSALRGD